VSGVVGSSMSVRKKEVDKNPQMNKRKEKIRNPCITSGEDILDPIRAKAAPRRRHDEASAGFGKRSRSGE
jgi:hypothetical protein